MDRSYKKQTGMAHNIITTVMLYAIVLLSFMVHMISYVASATAYVVILIVTSVLFAFGTLKITLDKSWFSLLWIAAVIVAAVSLGNSNRSANAIVDVLCLFCCMMIALFYSKDNEDYFKILRLICIAAIFFSAGILIQRFVPSIYDDLLNLFPSRYAVAVRTGGDNLISSGKRGFTANTGTSAGYICSGMIALVSLGTRFSKSRTVFFATMIFFFVALLFTGKRGPVLFLIVALFFRYVIPERGTKKMRRYWTGFVIIICIMVLYNIFGSFLVNVPLVRRFTEMIYGLIAGDDVSSLRFSLYAWAIMLFRKRPWIGIGWGDYRSTVVGNVSHIKALDVHNIYLQLLCETGIIGFVMFLILFISFWIAAKNAYYEVLKNEQFHQSKWIPILSFSFSFQSFFLLYGLTGNVLYDQHYQILYAISCGIVLTYKNFRRNELYRNQRI